MEEVFKTGTSVIRKEGDGIIRITLLPGAEQTLTSARSDMELVSRLINAKTVTLLIDIRQMKSITREARKYFSSNENIKYAAAEALLVGSFVTKVIGTFFLKINGHHHPVKLFTSEAKALEWLKGFLE